VVKRPTPTACSIQIPAIVTTAWCSPISPLASVSTIRPVPLPATKAIGIRRLGYFDPPATKDGKPSLIGNYACVVFETAASDGRRHAHRIYLNNNGTGKADLGEIDGKPRDPKKSALLRDGRPKTAGCCVVWGDVATAVHAIVAEGIETACAVAYAFKDEIENGTSIVLSAISAAGVGAFHPWPAITTVTVAADRDEGPGKNATGEKAARTAALRRLNGQRQIPYLLALPGQPGTSCDFLALFLSEGVDAVRAAILAAVPLEDKPALDGGDWPARAGLLEASPVPPFPTDFLPGVIGEFARKQAFDLQVPLDFVAIPVLISAATAIGPEFRMSPKAHASWEERACLWGGVIGYVGDGKTPAFNAALTPIWPLQAKWRAEFQDKLNSHKEAVKLAKMVNKQWEKDAAAALKKRQEPPPVPEDAKPPEPPVLREIVTNDTTQERLAELLMHNRRGVLLYRDELSGWFSSFNQYRPGADEQFYLQCHAGGPWQQHRKIGDVSILDIYLSIFGGFQPEVINAVLARGGYTGKPDNGLTARFSLLVWPDPTPVTWVDNSPDPDMRGRVNRLFERLSELDPERFVGARLKDATHYPALRFNPGGGEVFREWFVAHHERQQTFDPDAQIKGHFAKYDGLFARLALVHHLLRYVQNEPGIEPAGVDAVTARAVRDFIENYLRPHAHKIYRHLGRDPGYAGAKRIAQWLVENPTITRFTARDVSQKDWSGLTGRNENTGKNYLRAALEHLENVAGWVRAEEVPPGPRGGRPTTVYLVNPMIAR
jgi:hypothetical protein